MKQVVLASGSKRRSEILRSCNIDHTVVVTDVDEISGEACDIEKIVLTNSRLKAEKVKEVEKQSIVIGADTLVLAVDVIIGKPADETEAKKILKDLSGKEIKVYTGLCVMNADDKCSFGVDVSVIDVAPLDDKEVERYFSLLGPYDKAGGFSIEGVGSMIFDEIKGSYFNILGLPMVKLKSLFEEIGVDILDYVSTG